MNIEQVTGSGQEFVEGAKLEMFNSHIFVFSPKGDLYDLPEGATPVDFAFAVHSGLGLRISGAKVNGRIVTLDTRLENRDVVEILTRREASPNRDWLGFVQTTAARQRIKAWFRAQSREANIASGRALIETELKAFPVRRLEDLPSRDLKQLVEALRLKALEDVYAQLGEGAVTPAQVLRRIFPEPPPKSTEAPPKRLAGTGRVLIAGTNLPYALAACCNPMFPQPILGFVTRGKGVTVHLEDCPNIPAESERYIAAAWELSRPLEERLRTQLQLDCTNRIGLIRDITATLAARGVNIHGISSHNPEENRSEVLLTVGVPDAYFLARMMQALERVPGVETVVRTG